MPVDEVAQSNRVQQLSFAGILSQKSAREELNLQYTDDEKQIEAEQEQKIYRETYIKLKAEAQARKDFGLEDTAQDVVVDDVTGKDGGAIQKNNVDNNAPNK